MDQLVSFFSSFWGRQTSLCGDVGDDDVCDACGDDVCDDDVCDVYVGVHLQSNHQALVIWSVHLSLSFFLVVVQIFCQHSFYVCLLLQSFVSVFCCVWVCNLGLQNNHQVMPSAK